MCKKRSPILPAWPGGGGDPLQQCSACVARCFAQLANLSISSKWSRMQAFPGRRMPRVIRRIGSRHRNLADASQVPASVAKNSFGRMLDRVAKEGRLAITKHNEPCAVLISIDEYRALVGAEEVTL